MTDFQDNAAPQRSDHLRSRYAIDCAGAQIYVHARRLATVLRVDGEIDVSNATFVAQSIRQFSLLNAPLIIDVSHLEFLGIAGFRVLLDLSRDNGQPARRCRVVTGAALRRLTRVFADEELLIVDSVPAALHQIDEDIRARRRFVSGLARQLEPQRTTRRLRKLASDS
jgi:anti-anti-sigma factor